MGDRTQVILKRTGCCLLWLIGGIVVLMIIGFLPTPVLKQGKYVPPAPKADPADEQLADHQPPFDESFTLLAQHQGRKYWFNKSAAVISLDVVGLRGGKEAELAERIYPDFAAARDAISHEHRDFSNCAILPSIDGADLYAKQIDEQLIGALQRELHSGELVFTGGKQGFLTALLDELLQQPPGPARDEAAAYLAGAITLGAEEPAGLAAGIATAAGEEVQQFEENPFFAKPVSFYAEDATLSRVFQRDRLLMQPFGGTYWNADPAEYDFPLRNLEAAVAMAQVLDSRPDLLQAYKKYLALNQRLANPAVNFDLTDLLEHKQHFGNMATLAAALQASPQADLLAKRGNVIEETTGVAFWPFAASKESSLFGPILATMYELPNYRLMDVLTAAIKDGTVDLAPDADSGYYDYQLFTLETLLLPDRAGEAEKLLLKGNYLKRLQNAFEAMVAQRRETHIELYNAHIKGGSSHEDPALLYPNFTVEPVPELFLRQARSYRALHAWLAGILGEDALAEVNVPGDNWAANRICFAPSGDLFFKKENPASTDGTEEIAAISLAQALINAQAVFYGLYLLSCDEIGLPPLLDRDELAFLDPADADRLDELAYLHIDLKCRLLSRYEQSSYYVDYYKRFADCDDVAAYLDTCQQLMPFLNNPELTDEDALRALSALHAASAYLLADSFLKKDARVITPVAMDPLRGETRCWAVTGVKLKRISAKYEVPPGLLRCYNETETGRAEAGAQMQAGDQEAAQWIAKDYLVPVYAFSEMTIKGEPLSRAEFRQLCDQGETEAEINALVNDYARRPRANWLLPAALGLGLALAVVIALVLVRRKRT